VGALARDKRAAKKEARRDEQLDDFSIGVYLVTNAQYGVYLEDAKSDSYPEYWDNPDYNQPDQPVIGLSLTEAQAYAAWLSDKIGAVMRLPTEGEWEKAARGGQDAIYPWGDQLPSDGSRANYSGNGRFKATSPVGSFENGRNAYGLYDMAGNVWQWTLATRDADGDGMEESSIVKGGSWMDGQTDLRVSNRRELDPSKPYADVGFRLVREVSHE
jgi:formylglycine-generating enzyme required for sulfatase activity